MKKRNNSVLLSVPYILWMLAFTLIPLGVVGYYALTDPDTGAFTWSNLGQLGTYLPVFGRSIGYSVVTALLCLLQDTGIINDILEAIGIGRKQLIRTPGAVILGMVYNYLPYMILPLYSTIVKINPRLIEAAEDLGCNSLQVFRLVTLPLSMPGILSGITMVFVPAVSPFYISQKLGGTDTVLIGDVIERQFKQGNNPNLGAALSLVLMLLVFV